MAQQYEHLIHAALDPSEKREFMGLMEAYVRQNRVVWDDKQDKLDRENPGRDRYKALDKELENQPFPGTQIAQDFIHVQTTGTIESYLNVETRKHLHIDKENGQFYDQDKNPISKAEAVKHILADLPRHDPNRDRLYPELEAKYRPLEKRIDIYVADEFEWKSKTGNVITYQHPASEREVHLDTSTGQFHASNGNSITATEALSRALPSRSEQIHPKEQTPENSLSL